MLKLLIVVEARVCPPRQIRVDEIRLSGMRRANSCRADCGGPHHRVMLRVGRSAQNPRTGSDPGTGSDDNLGWAFQARDHSDPRPCAPQAPVGRARIRARHFVVERLQGKI